MKKGLLLIAFSFLTLSLFAQTIVSTNPENKNVVLEEFTGIHCTYCPQGHAIAQGIQDANEGDVFLINIHTGGYAVPSAGEPDFRTDFGDAIAGQSGLTGYPAGTVNRHLFSGYSQGSGTAQSRGDWAATSDIILGESSYVNVAVEAEVDINTRELTVHVEAYYTGDSPESTNLLNVALLQNNTLGPQVGGNAGNDYNHMHRLVYMITGQWGEEISTTTTGTFVDRTYTYTLPTDYREVEVLMNNLEIVAFVSETHQEIVTGGGCYPELTGLENNNDANINLVTVPKFICEGEITPSIVISNVGIDDLTSLEITYQINSETPQTYSWTGELGTLYSEEIELPTIIFTPEEINTFVVTLQDDDNNDNNSITEEIIDAPMSVTWVTIDMETGDNGSDFSWELRNSSGIYVDGGEDYENNESLSISFDLEPDCYNLIVNNGGGTGASIVIGDYYSDFINIDGDWGEEIVANFKTEITPIDANTNVENGTTNFAVGSNLRIFFGQPVRNIDDSPISINPVLPVTLTDGSKNDIPFNLSISADRTKLTINPVDDLEPTTEYTLTLEGGSVENYYDMALEEDATTTFTTGFSVNIVENNNEINIFPNPAKDILNIENAENAEIQIYNIVGELIISTKQTSVDVSSLATGTYIVKVISENNTTTKKINISK